MSLTGKVERVLAARGDVARLTSLFAEMMRAADCHLYVQPNPEGEGFIAQVDQWGQNVMPSATIVRAGVQEAELISDVLIEALAYTHR